MGRKISSLRSLGLTPREAEILLWISEGKTNYEVALIVGAKAGTVRKHVEHILSKLSVENRTAAAAIAFTVISQTADFFQRPVRLGLKPLSGL